MAGYGAGPDHRADDVVRVLHVGHPVADGLVGGVLEGAAARGHREHLGPEQPHAEHVELLAADVLLAHVHVAFEAEERGHRGRGHAVLPGAGLGDDALLAHAHGQQDLAEGVVDLVRAGVGQVLPLEVDPAPGPLRQAVGAEERRGPAGVVGLQRAQFGQEGRVVAVALVGRVQLLEGRHQGLGYVAAPVGAEAVLVWSSPSFLPIARRTGRGVACGSLTPG